MGFFDQTDLTKVLEEIKVSEEFTENKGAEIVQLLSPVFNKSSIQDGIFIEDIFQRIFKSFVNASQ
jgi:effector-binding domain-containing protein